MLVRALYQWQIAECSEDAILEQFAGEDDFARADQSHFRRILREVIASSETLDAVIAQHASRGLDQLDAVGRAVLLLALAELGSCADVPTKVVINEAVELTKRYGAADSYRFVNAVLDKAARQIRSA